MNRVAVAIALIGLGLAGCERQHNTPAQSDKPMREDRKPGTDVNIDTPGVKVDVHGRGGPDATKRGADVNVETRPKDTRK